MAILKAPLLSLGASGALGKTLVYFGWKGLDVVREYVVPANPKTGAQTTQRGFLAGAVAMIHTAMALAANGIDALDTAAYALWGSTEKSPRTWFNQACKNWIDVEVAGAIPVIFSDGECIDPDKTDALLSIYLNEETPSSLVAATFFYGTSPTALINSIAGVVTAGDKVDLTDAAGIAGLVAGVKYFWQLRANAADPCEGAKSGIYYFVATTV
ncbi:hypothetical protein ES705_27062 [subsurface metagenome]